MNKKNKSSVIEQTYDAAVILIFLFLGTLASPPDSMTFAIWLLVGCGILQFLATKIYKSAVSTTQLRISSVYKDFRESSSHWKNQCKVYEQRIKDLEASFNIDDNSF